MAKMAQNAVNFGILFASHGLGWELQPCPPPMELLHVYSGAMHLRHTLLAISTLHAHAIDAVALLGLVAHLPSLTIEVGLSSRPQEQDSMPRCWGENQQHLAE